MSGKQQEDHMLDAALGSEKKIHVGWLCGPQQALSLGVPTSKEGFVNGTSGL